MSYNNVTPLNYNDKERLYAEMKEDIITKVGLPLYEIIPSLEIINDSNHYLLDGSVYRKDTEKDLYNIFGDNFKSHANRDVQDGEFALPNLSGRYLVGKHNSERGFENSDAALQAFAIESKHYFGFNPLNNIVKKYYKSKESSNTSSSSIESDKIIKKIIPYDFNNKRRSISIDDKAYLFYIKRIYR